MRTRARRIAVRVSEEQYNKISRLTERSFFTKEQVLKMSPAEIKKNYEKIRESQQRWK